MGLGKLIGVERTINIYKKSKSKISVESLDEINIDGIPLEELKKIVVENPEDPLLYYVYPLDKKQIALLNEFIEHKIIPNLKLYEYYLACYGIYER